MSAGPFSFEYGAAEGRRVVEFVRASNAHRNSPRPESRRTALPAFGINGERRAKFWARLPGHRPPVWMDGLISTLLPAGYVDVGVLKFEPFELPRPHRFCELDTLSYDDDAAPMCNGPWHEWGLTGFAHWDGECCGDAWFLDLRAGTLGALHVSGGDDESYEAQVAGAYKAFHDPADWRRFLVSENLRRGSLSERDAATLLAG